MVEYWLDIGRHDDYKKAQELILKSEELDRRIHFTQEGLKDALKLMQERKMF